jgi:hypothetical protein
MPFPDTVGSMERRADARYRFGERNCVGMHTATAAASMLTRRDLDRPRQYQRRRTRDGGADRRYPVGSRPADYHGCARRGLLLR